MLDSLLLPTIPQQWCDASRRTLEPLSALFGDLSMGVKKLPVSKKKWFVQNVFQLCLVGSRHIFSTRHFEFLAVCKETGWQCLVSIESLSFSSVCGQCAFVPKARGCSVTVDFVRWESIPVPCGYEVGAWVIGPSDGPRKGRWSLLIHSVRLRRTGMPLKKRTGMVLFFFRDELVLFLRVVRDRNSKRLCIWNSITYFLLILIELVAVY